MRNDSHNIIIPHAHPCRVWQNFRRDISRFSLFLSLGITAVSPSRDRHGCSVRRDLSQNRPLGLHRRSDAPRAQFRPRTKLSLYHIRPEPSLRGTTLRGHLWHNNCLTRNTVQSRQRVPDSFSVHDENRLASKY